MTKKSIMTDNNKIEVRTTFELTSSRSIILAVLDALENLDIKIVSIKEKIELQRDGQK